MDALTRAYEHQIKTPVRGAWPAAKLSARSRNGSVLIVGSANSMLVDEFLMAGYVDITVLGDSSSQFEATKRRLGPIAKYIGWREADVLETELSESAYDVWHDLALFRQLPTKVQREHYVGQVVRALKPEGMALIGALAPIATENHRRLPPSCEDADEICSAFGTRLQFAGICRPECDRSSSTIEQVLYAFARS